MASDVDAQPAELRASERSPQRDEGLGCLRTARRVGEHQPPIPHMRVVQWILIEPHLPRHAGRRCCLPRRLSCFIRCPPRRPRGMRHRLGRRRVRARAARGGAARRARRARQRLRRRILAPAAALAALLLPLHRQARARSCRTGSSSKMSSTHTGVSQPRPCAPLPACLRPRKERAPRVARGCRGLRQGKKGKRAPSFATLCPPTPSSPRTLCLSFLAARYSSYSRSRAALSQGGGPHAKQRAADIAQPCTAHGRSLPRRAQRAPPGHQDTPTERERERRRGMTC